MAHRNKNGSRTEREETVSTELGGNERSSVDETGREIRTDGGTQQVRTDGGQSSSDSGQTVAGILALLLGAFGAHKFYQGATKLGLVYLCFSWTLIPGLIGFVEGILILVADEAEYEEKYADGSILGR